MIKKMTIAIKIVLILANFNVLRIRLLKWQMTIMKKALILIRWPESNPIKLSLVLWTINRPKSSARSSMRLSSNKLKNKTRLKILRRSRKCKKGVKAIKLILLIVASISACRIKQIQYNKSCENSR